MTQTARLYGDSLYDLAAEEEKTEELLEEMAQVRDLFRAFPEYLSLLSNPAIPRQERDGLIEEAFGASAERYLVNFMKLLCDRNLLREFSGCCEAFTRRYNKDHNIAEALVTSAVPLSEGQKAALTERLEKLSGKKVQLSVKVSPSVIAGLRVELEGKQLDGTVQGRLSGLSRKLNDIIV